MVKAGRFGEYVTDGEYNATLRKDDSVEAITLERAAELLAERRAKGPAKKAAKRGAKKSTAKKSGQEDDQEGRRRSPEPGRRLASGSEVTSPTASSPRCHGVSRRSLRSLLNRPAAACHPRPLG